MNPSCVHSTLLLGLTGDVEAGGFTSSVLGFGSCGAGAGFSAAGFSAAAGAVFVP